MYFVYSLLMGLAALLLVPYWLVQGLRQGKYLFNLGQRLGFSFPSLAKLPAQRPGAIWIHAVSVGEVLSSITLARRLKEAYPDRPLIVSTTTVTGHALARERAPFADAIFYFPLDWTFCVRRAIDAVKPSLVLVLETEIWPNFLREARRRGIPVLFVSGRISDRSFARYQSCLGAFGFFLRPFLKDALSNASAFLMQSEKDAERLRALVEASLQRRSRWRSSRSVLCRVNIRKHSSCLRLASRSVSMLPRSLSTNRTASSSGGPNCRFQGRHKRKLVRLPVTVPYTTMSPSFCSTASESSPPFIGWRTAPLSEARSFLPAATIFWNPLLSAKFPCLGRPWKILRKLLLVSFLREPLSRWTAPKTPEWPGSNSFVTQSG